MNQRMFHVELGGGREPSPYFFLNNLLQSRMEVGHPSNEAFYDEDVSVYLAHCLCSLFDPVQRQWREQHVVLRDTDLLERIKFTNPRVRHEYYRVNADFLLLHLGLFDRLPCRLSAGWTPDEGLVRRGETYYTFATAYASQLPRFARGIADVCAKLARGFVMYRTILQHLSRQHLNFIVHLSTGEVYHLGQAAHRAKTADLWDAYLDARNTYECEPSAQNRGLLEQARSLLQEVDPTFRQATGEEDPPTSKTPIP